MKLRHWLCWAAGWLADWRVCKRVFHPGDYLPLPLLLDNAFVRFWNFTCWDGTKQTYVVSVAYSEWRSPLSIVNVAGKKKNTEFRCCIFFLYFYYLSFRIGAAHEAVIEQTQRTQKQQKIIEKKTYRFVLHFLYSWTKQVVEEATSTRRIVKPIRREREKWKFNKKRVKIK